jgi:predicted lactoylglutathione lyase
MWCGYPTGQGIIKTENCPMIFVNLPVTDLAASTRFYEAIGCRKNAQFSDHKASSMVWSDTITIQLLAREFFATFTTKPVADAHATCQVMLCLSRDSRDEVDRLVVAAAKAGGKADVRAPIEMDFMYNRAFEDPDGHEFELVWLNPAAMPGRETAAA